MSSRPSHSPEVGWSRNQRDHPIADAFAVGIAGLVLLHDQGGPFARLDEGLLEAEADDRDVGRGEIARDNTESRSIRARLCRPGSSDLADWLLLKKGADSSCLVLPLMFIVSARGRKIRVPKRSYFNRRKRLL